MGTHSKSIRPRSVLFQTPDMVASIMSPGGVPESLRRVDTSEVPKEQLGCGLP
jgi:hypothetical protein